MSVPMRHQNGEDPGNYRSAQQDQVMARVFDHLKGPLVAVDPFGNYQRASVAAGNQELPGTILTGQPISAGHACAEEAASRSAAAGLAIPLHDKIQEANLVPALPSTAAFPPGIPVGQRGVQLFMVNTPGVVKQEVAGGAAVALPSTRMDEAEAARYQDSGEAAKKRRIEARKERNRRAQRSFRQRQKSRMAALEGEVETLSARLDGLKSNNSTLQANSALLQKVLQVREEQLTEVQRCLDCQEMADSHGKQFLSAYPLLSFGMELSMIEWKGCKIALTPEFIANLNVDSAKEIWLVYGRELRQRIDMSAQDQGPKNAVVMDEALRLTGELGCLLFLYNVADPSNLLKMMEAIQCDMAHVVNPVSAAEGALKKMELDEGQKVAIIEKWRLLMDVHKGKLQEIAECKQVIASQLPALGTQTALNQLYIRHHEAIEKMHGLALQLHDAEMKYIYDLVTEILRTEQAAQLIAGCFPLPPQYFVVGELLSGNAPGTLEGRAVPAGCSDHPEDKPLACNSLCGGFLP